MPNTTKPESQQVDFTDNVILADELEATTAIDTPSLEIGGTAVTSTAAELNILDGVTSTAAELNILDGVTATAAELNMAADSSANVEVVTTTNVITAAESGTTYFLNSATGFVSTLPAPAAGLRFRFVCIAVPTSGAHTVVPTGGSDIFQGNVMVASTVDPVVGQDTLSFDQDDADIGDWIEVISDGTSWFVSGSFTTTGGFSHAQS